MKDNIYFATDSNMEIEVYFEPITDAFNITPFQGSIFTMNNVDSLNILDEYSRRFEDAWKELADQ